MEINILLALMIVMDIIDGPEADRLKAGLAGSVIPRDWRLIIKSFEDILARKIT